jgi:hypothetical protein
MNRHVMPDHGRSTRKITPSLAGIAPQPPASPAVNTGLPVKALQKRPDDGQAIAT